MVSRSAPKPPRGIVQKEHFIDSIDSGIRLHIREKRPKGKRRFESAATLLLVHGRGASAPVAFDLPVPGYSWMDEFAARGYNVFALSVRGFGLSTRPPEMLDDNPAGKPPAIRGKTVVRDIDAAVRFIRKYREVDKLNILGRSWGSTTVPAFTADNNHAVRRIVLYSPYYALANPERAARFEDPAHPGKWDSKKWGAWFWTTEKDLRHRWWGHIRGSAHHRWRDSRVVRAVWKERLRYDPEGARRKPTAVRSPNGSYADLYDRAHNKPLYSAAKIRCPALLIFGDHDGSANEPEAWGLFEKLKNSKGKKYVVMGDGTHYMEFEKRREELFREVRLFLES